MVDKLDLKNEYNETSKINNSGCNINIYEITEDEIKNLPTTQIIEQTIEDENNASVEQEVEDEGFETQGKIAYEGSSEYPEISLGNYVGLTYYNQIDSRWRNHPYTSIGNSTQTIGTGGCGPTAAAMIVTATKGTITPDDMGDLFVRYGYRSPDNGTYWSAFRWVADVFNIGYQETSNFETAINLLKNNNYIIASVGNGLFTTGGHFIVIVGIDGNNLKIYDPYLYAGKFDTSTRRGKVSLNGNTVYCSISNFKNYANYKNFFAFKHDENIEENTTNIVYSTYTRYVQTSSGVGLNIRSGAGTNYKKVGTLQEGSKVDVYETSGNWSRIGTNEWVCSDYLVSNKENSKFQNTVGQTRKTGSCYIYSNSNLTGTRYQYLANTSVKILQNVSNIVDKIQVIQTGRIAFVRNDSYK